MNFLKNGTILILLLIWYTLGYFTFTFAQNKTISNQDGTYNILQSSKIQEAYTYLEKYYYGFHKKTNDEREDALIDALTKSLWDKHTSYFNPKDAQEFTESLSGDFEGIGAVIKEHPKGIQIMKVLEDSPAKKWWLLNGDIITKIWETSAVWLPTEDAVEIIRWPKWSTVVLQILSSWEEKEVSIQRDRVVVPSVYSDTLTWTTIWYIEIGFFGANTTEEFITALDDLIKNEATGIIIDARNNGWGYLDSAVEISSTLLTPGQLVVETRGIRPSENMDYKTQKQTILNTKIPIVMIVNNMSASATEIVAGALQDYDRAIIIGQKTYGKWSVQEPFLLSDGSMMKITIAKWFTPLDRGIDEKWIDPDVVVDLRDEDYKNTYDRQLEWAKIILSDLIEKKIEVSEYKKDREIIEKLLQDAKIYE